MIFCRKFQLCIFFLFVAKVTERFGVSECVVRSVISQKCKEEMVIRRRRLTLEMQISGADKVA